MFGRSIRTRTEGDGSAPHGVVVVGHGTRQEDVDLAALRGLDQAIGERVVGLGIGSEQELTLRTPAGDHVELTREDLTRQHAAATIKNAAMLRFCDLAMLGCRLSE